MTENASRGGQLLFGRVTYGLMRAYWPAALVYQNDPVIATRINEAPRLVFARTLREAGWNITQVVQGSV